MTRSTSPGPEVRTGLWPGHSGLTRSTIDTATEGALSAHEPDSARRRPWPSNNARHRERTSRNGSARDVRSVCETVDVLCVAEVSPAQRPGKRLFGFGRRDQMDMVGHQTITLDRQPVLLGLLKQQPEVRITIISNEEHVLAIVSPLRDVMRAIRYDDPGNPWHARILHLFGSPVNR